MGVLAYDQYVSDGRTKYLGANNFEISSNAKYASLEIPKTGDIGELKHALEIHQNGETDYLTFCKQSAKAGAKKWVVDTEKKLYYYDESGNEMVVEVIPS